MHGGYRSPAGDAMLAVLDGSARQNAVPPPLTAQRP